MLSIGLTPFGVSIVLWPEARGTVRSKNRQDPDFRKRPCAARFFFRMLDAKPRDSRELTENAGITSKAMRGEKWTRCSFLDRTVDFPPGLGARSSRGGAGDGRATSSGRRRA